jgi:hypothetical protein
MAMKDTGTLAGPRQRPEMPVSADQQRLGSLPSDLRLPLGGGTTGYLRHVTFATKRDFAGALGDTPIFP